MSEWRLNIILAKNPQFVRLFGNSIHSIIRKVQCINEGDREV